MNSAEQILKLRTVSYHVPLEKARSWIRSGDSEGRLEAVKLLEGLRKKYPHALQIGQELALAEMECGDSEKAEETLNELAPLLRNPDEEILCRWGRLYKDHGDRYAGKPESAAGTSQAHAASAEQYYRRSLEKYDEAYQIREGHYPGINKAALSLIVGTLPLENAREAQQARDREESVTLARELLARRAKWRRTLDDDNIWHPATAAEAHLLLQEWREAGELYQIALDQPNCRWHRESMLKQVERLLQCFRRLDVDTSPFPKEVLFPAKSGSPAR